MVQHDMCRVVFISLLLDLIAFTIILPLLPSIFVYYKQNDKTSFHMWIWRIITYFQELVGAPSEINIVLFGGFIGSMFSFLQFLASPITGALSDVYGRKIVMLVSLAGVSFSYLLWIYSRSLLMFITARFIGGISKNNVSLSSAIISDILPTSQRGRGMALIGISFSVGFIVGPMVGASFGMWAKRNMSNWLIIPAALSFFLSTTNLLFFSRFFKESLPVEKRAPKISATFSNIAMYINVKHLFAFQAVSNSMPSHELQRLRRLGFVYFVYLFIYSGLEFTLTFLTHYVHNFTSMQQGWMFFTIGVIMAIVQGTYVRKLQSWEIHVNATYALWVIVPAFICVGFTKSVFLLYLGIVLFALSTAVVVPCLMTMASDYGTEDGKGCIMGTFRSLGALARAIGPICASISFWVFGHTATYIMGGLCLIFPGLLLEYI